MRNEKISLLKFIDHWVGGPMCIVLAFFNRICHPFYKTHLSIPPESLPPRNILIIKFFGLGSITLASALVANIRKAYKDSRLIFLTFKDNVPMLEMLSLADEYLIIDTKNPVVLLGSIGKTILYCHRCKMDISMDLEFYSKFSTIMSFLSGARWRMGFYMARFWRNSLVNVPVYFNYSRHILEIYGMFAQAMNIGDLDLYPKVAVFAESEKNDLAKFLQDEKSLNLQKAVGLNIHASDLALCRRWPLPKFVELTGQFLARYDQWNIVLTGVESEKAYTKEFLALLPAQWHSRVINLTGALTLKQFLILLSQLPLFITNDTGPFHLAKFTGTRTISLWGPGSVDLYGPYLKEKEFHDVIYKRYSCSPCLYVYRTDAGYFCGHQAPCMQAIEPLDVMSVVHQRLRPNS